jgi:inner membrane transporter RhtA
MNWTFYECIDRLPLGVAVTIELVGPLALAVAGSRRAVDALWIVLAVSGVLLLALDGNHHGVTAFGVVLALIAAVGWACYILLSKRVGRSFATLDALSIALFVGAVVVTPAGLIEGGSALLRPSILAGGAAVAVLSSIVPFSLEIMALRRLSASTFGLLMSLEPAVAALAGLLVRGQPVTAVLVVAVVFVIFASVGTTVTARKPLEVVAAGPQ